MVKTGREWNPRSKIQERGFPRSDPRDPETRVWGKIMR